MRGLVRGCLLQLALWAAGTAAVQIYLRSVAPVRGEVWPVSIALGLLAAMGVWLVVAAATAAAERRMLVRAAAGTTPADGSWVAVSGEIDTRTPVQAPLSGDRVVAYEYKIVRDERIGRSSSPVTYYEGKALAASTIATPHGAIRLLAVPSFDMAMETLIPKDALANAVHYLRTTTFEKRDTARQRTSALEREWADDDGVFRIDKTFFAADVDLEDRFRFEERRIRPRDPVCAFGVYSTARAGLVPDTKWGRPTRIVRGTAADAARMLNGRIVKYLIGALILGALTYGLTMAYAKHIAAL
jgi:hypothetical protein